VAEYRGRHLARVTVLAVAALIVAMCMTWANS
jgi:hypothetical protein